MVCKFRYLLSPNFLFYTIGVVGCTYACLEQDWKCLAGGILLLSGAGFLSVSRLRRQRESLDLIMEAVENGDNTFRLPSGHLRNASVELFNAVANRMGNFLSEEKLALEVREKYYEVILEHVSTGVVVLDGDCDRVVLCNETALRLLNVPRLALLSQLPEDKWNVGECFKTLQPGGNELLAVHTRQGVRQLMVKVVILVRDEVPLRVFTLNDVRNILDEHEMDAWVKLTRVLVHEIVNGMTPVCSLSSSMLEKTSLSAGQLHDGLAAIHATSQGLLAFVENYRRFTSLPKPCPDIFYVKDLLNEVGSLQLLPPHIRLTVRILPDDVMVYADMHLIRQVLINLLCNAVQAIGEKPGRVDITSELTENEHVLIYVSNDGPAIKEDAEQLFVPFYTTKQGGSGIGLSVSRQIMLQSNGSITLLPSGTRGWNTVFLLDFA